MPLPTVYRIASKACLVTTLGTLMALAGCAALGVAASALPPATVAASYKDLEGQTVGVMVWADRAIRIDFPSIQVDMATAVQQKLQGAGKAKSKGLQNVKWVEARSIARFQQEHPEFDAAPVVDVAPKLGVTRLIYVEVEDFQTRSQALSDLFKGSATVTLKVIEVGGGGASKIGFEQNGVRSVFPRRAPEEGIPGSDDYTIYRGTVQEITDLIALRFVAHPET
jgi:hypothetical protein